MSRGTAYYDLPNGERIELPTTMPDVEEVPGPLCDGKFELPEAVKEMIDFSSTVVELSGDSEKQKEVQDIAKCLRTLYSTPIGSQEGDRELGINPNIFVDKPLPVAKGLYVAEVTEKTASFEPRARVVRVDWLDSDVLHGVVIPKVVYELV